MMKRTMIEGKKVKRSDMKVRLANESERMVYGDVNVKFSLVPDYQCICGFKVIDLQSHHQAILGLTWVTSVNPAIDWKNGVLVVRQ